MRRNRGPFRGILATLRRLIFFAFASFKCSIPAEGPAMLLTDRRLLLAALSASLVPGPIRAALAADGAVRLGPPQPFSFPLLVAWAEKNASLPYKPPQTPAARLIAGIDFDAVQKIRFRPDHALWQGRAG